MRRPSWGALMPRSFFTFQAARVEVFGVLNCTSPGGGRVCFVRAANMYSQDAVPAKFVLRTRSGSSKLRKDSIFPGGNNEVSCSCGHLLLVDSADRSASCSGDPVPGAD